MNAAPRHAVAISVTRCARPLPPARTPNSAKVTARGYANVSSAMLQIRGARVDRLLRPVHRWIWGDFDRRVRKLLAFAEVEADGGRDILRRAEGTADPLFRRRFVPPRTREL